MEQKKYILKEKFKNGDIIIEEGFSSNYAYVVIEGKVKVSKKIGDKKVIIGTLKKGAVFGEMGLLEQTPRTATVTAIEKVEVGMIDRENFMHILNESPDNFKNIVQALVERLKITTEKLAKIGLQLESVKKLTNTLSLQAKEK